MCELPSRPVPFKSEWSHLKGLQLADPDFGRPGPIDLLLGMDVFVDILLTGRRLGQHGTPSAFRHTLDGCLLVQLKETLQ